MAANLREETIKVLRDLVEVVGKNVYPKPDVGPEHPWSVLCRGRDFLSRLEAGSGEETDAVGSWNYSINYGPDGEENYANVYTPDGKLVGNLRINHAIAIVDGLNAAKADRPHVATPAPGENSERANLELRLTELANAIERKSPSLALHDSRLVREAIRSLSTSYAAGRRSMRKKAARVVSQARFGEIDSDLRSILAAIRAIP